MTYGIRVNKNGTLYLNGRRYVSLQRSEKTSDMVRLSAMVEYANNDLNNDSIDSFDIVQFDVSVTVVDLDLTDTARQIALKKLNKKDREVLGV